MADEKWGWWASRDEENYTTGPEANREAVIALGRIDFDGESFHIIEATQSDPGHLIPSASDLISSALERAADDGEFGEDGDYDLSGKREEQEEAFAELDAALSAWTAKWKRLLPRPWAFRSTRNGEWIAGTEQPAEPAEFG